MPSRPKRSRRALSVTSLIDVIFLLLLFFMLTSTFTKFAEVELMTNGSGASSDQSTRPKAFLRLDRSELTLNGRPVTADTIEAAIAALGHNSAPAVLLSLTPETTAQELTDVIVPLRRLPDIDLTVLDPA